MAGHRPILSERLIPGTVNWGIALRRRHWRAQYAGAMSASTATATITIEHASIGDLPAAADVYQAAARSLSDQLRAVDPWTSVSARTEDRHLAIDTLAGLLESDQRSVVVAREADRIVGLGAVRIQGPHAHIAFLFVHPECQGRGIGRDLLTRLGSRIDESGATMVTLASSRDRRAWQRYLRFGLRPGPPLMALRAAQPRFPRRPDLDCRLRMRPIGPADIDRIASLDEVVRGAPRHVELASWIESGDGIQLVDRTSGELAGYALVSTRTANCQIGPVVTRERDDMPAALHLALILAGTHPNPKRLPWRVDCSSRNQLAVEPLLNAGFAIDGLIHWFESGPVGRWDHYIFRDEDAL